MGVKFDTRPVSLKAGEWSPKGEPLRARTCRCGPLQDLDLDGLCACGYWPKATVDRTWSDQARRQGYREPVSVLDSYRRTIMERRYGKAA